MEQTTLKQLIDFNDKLISENGNELTAFEVHQKVIQKAAELLEQERQNIVKAFEEGYTSGYYDNGKNGLYYYNDNFGELSQ